LLPSIGVHIDLRSCCGSIENLGIAHSADIQVDNCCHTQKTAACTEQEEIVQGPVYQDLASETPLEVQDAPVFEVQTNPFCNLAIVSNEVQDDFLSFASIRRKPSFLQVFLC
jgi:hypothetical protein